MCPHALFLQTQLHTYCQADQSILVGGDQSTLVGGDQSTLVGV